jgi:plasmid stabilization system protein ParE
MLELTILSSFYEELDEILDYISNTLEAPGAARNLTVEVRKVIKDLREFPFAHRLYRSPESLPLEFRIITVKNYLIFYTVKDFIEVHHIFYKRRDLPRLLEKE